MGIIHDFKQAFVGTGLKPTEGWVPTWKNGVSTDASDGTLYAPKPGQSNDMAEDATREMAASAQIRGEVS